MKTVRKKVRKTKQWPTPSQFAKLMGLIAEKYDYMCFLRGNDAIDFRDFIREYKYLDK